ncbi:response regulator [Belliella pelovolcani]|uniref:GAF domain-containing hybrid sensor histidine kinase/response regulator n=1 Tax=Belliella pelovolcani TaxID=529505 RepID=UPI003919C1C7
MKAKEIDRLKTVLSYNILDTPAEEDLDKIAELIAMVCEVPIAIISIIDDRRQWYKAKVGVDNDEVPVEDSFCQFTLIEDRFLEITAVQDDERVKGKPAAQGVDGLKFYAGVPLKAPDGHNIGTACVASSKPHKLTEKQKKAFELLADQAMTLIDAKRSNQILGDELKTILDRQKSILKKSIKQKESEFNALIQAISLSNALVQFNPDGTVFEANQIFASYLGFTSEELRGIHHDELLFEEDRKNNNAFWESLNQGNFKSGQMKRKHRSGKEIWLLATYNPILDSEGKVFKIIKIAQEITSSIESRKALQKAKDDAIQLNIQKDNFLANVSHELRTPLHAILGFTKLLLEEETDTIKTEYLNAVKTAGDNLLFTVNDILDLSKIESGTILIEQLEFDIHQLIHEVASFLKIKAVQKKISFTVEIDAEVPKWIIGDKNRLGQILINLIGNGIKFTDKGYVKLKLERVRENTSQVILKFRIQDTGIGIALDKLSVIFDRFSQSDEKISRRFGGTGLGLNISKSLVEKMDGTIEVSSKVGLGSEFSFTIPFQRGQQPIEKSKEAAVSFTQSKQVIKILLCEDNEINQTLVKTLLRPANFDLVIASNGEEGIQRFQEMDFDLVLMDIQMPIMDGYQTTIYLREKLHTQVPIIALTANYMLKEKQKCLELGMNDYLSKPFKKEELFEKIYLWGDSVNKKQLITKTEEDQAAEAPVDLNVLKEYSGGDEAFEHEMMQMFIGQVEKWKTAMDNHMAIADFKNIADSSHKMKSSFSVLGADTKDLINLEDLAELEDIDGIEAVYSRVKQYLKIVIPFLENKMKK